MLATTRHLTETRESKPFLQDAEADVALTTDAAKHSRPKLLHLSLRWAVYIQLFLIFLYIACTVVFVKLFTDNTRSGTTDVKHQSLSRQNVRFVLAYDSHYAGGPSPELDIAWQELLAKSNIRVTKEELRRNNQSSVTLPDGGGYLAWLEAHHQLHCVKMLRQWTYRAHYHPSLTDGDVDHWLLHADHCLELLRQAVMCKADTTIMTFKWDKDPSRPMLKLEGPPHDCVNWDELMSTMESRVVTDEEMDGLINPIYVS